MLFQPFVADKHLCYPQLYDRQFHYLNMALYFDMKPYYFGNRPSCVCSSISVIDEDGDQEFDRINPVVPNEVLVYATVGTTTIQ